MFRSVRTQTEEVGGIGGYSTGKALGKSGWDLFAYTAAGAGIGVATAGIGTPVTTGTTATLGATGSALVGGTVAGAFNGAAMAGLGGGNIGQGAMYGAIGGFAGSTAGLANVNGIIPGALYGAGTGGLISGGLHAAQGGNFWDGAKQGAISGGILGGISGGISATQSKYERNILFGGVTRSGKQHFLNDLAITSDAYSKGLNDVILGRHSDFDPGVNAETHAIVNGNEINFSEYSRLLPGAGTKANIYMKPASLRQMASTFGHEMVHVSDIYSGYGRIAAMNLMIKYRTPWGGVDWQKYGDHLQGHFEYRAYQYNINHGYRVDVYRNELLKWAPYAGF
jgi:hypothetical protein